jgi:hypothetical protein
LVDNSSYLMSCGDNAWDPLISLTSYICYSPSLVARKLRFERHSTYEEDLGFNRVSGLFQDSNSLAELGAIKRD